MEGEIPENSDVPYIMPMFNSEEKIQEVNRLLEILAKRKKYSIVVTMLLVFQKFNYQKIMREYLLSGVKQIIIENPLRVVSYHGVPFTTKNFIRGMRVEYGKHKLFNKEMIDGIEYYYTNIVYTCIYLSDEIAKICKGSKNLKTVHYSLIDDLELEGQANFPMNVDNGNNLFPCFICRNNNVYQRDNRIGCKNCRMGITDDCSAVFKRCCNAHAGHAWRVYMESAGCQQQQAAFPYRRDTR